MVLACASAMAHWAAVMLPPETEVSARPALGHGVEVGAGGCAGRSPRRE